MDHSIHDVMNDLVAADAARMSGRDFADARGAGLARKVRTRRTVRAAGMGGASAVAVGGLAFGAMHLPGRGTMTPGVWPGACTPTAVANIGAIWVVPAVPRAHVIDVSADHDHVTWYLYDDNLQMVVLQMVPTAAGLEVTFADGNQELVTAGPASTYVFGAPGGGYVTFDPTDDAHHAKWTAGDPADWSPVKALSKVTPPFAWQWTGCGFGSSSAVPDPSLAASPSPSTDPSLAASTERVTSPFQCGYFFGKQSSDAPHLKVTGTASTTPAGTASTGDNSGDAAWTNGTVDKSGNAAHGVANESLGGGSSAVYVSGGTDPADPAVRAKSENYKNGTYKGVGFVSVRDGVVVGTLSQHSTGSAPRLSVNIMGEHGFAASLSHPESAFDACSGEAPSTGSVDVYFVASAVTMKSGEPNPVAGPEYAWAEIGTFTGDATSN